MIAIFKRELKAYFQSVIGWLFVAAILAAYGLYFFAYNLRSGTPYIHYPLNAICLVFIIAIPILTMRSFADEKHSRTDQLMLTAPVSIGKIVLGKYLALVAVFTIDVLLFALTPLFLHFFGTVPMGENYVSILGFWLCGCACISVGMFISSLTESQVIAAVLAFAALFVSYMMNGITGLISSEGNLLTKVLSCFDLFAPFDEFTGGCLDLTGVVYYLSAIAILCFLTSQSIQKRRWSMSRTNIATGVFSTGFIAVAMVLVVVVNLLVHMAPSTITAIDATYEKLYAITDQTKDFLKKLDTDVTIYALVSETKKDAKIDEMLGRYEDLSSHIHVKYVSPASKPYFYQDYTDQAPTMNSLIVVSDARSKVVDYNELYIYDTSMDYSTYQYNNTLTGFDAEGQITSAIEYVTMEDKDLPVVYEVTGHDEASLGSAFKDLLAKANMTLSSVELLNQDSVPDDAALLIINAPQKDFNDADTQKVKEYLAAGGKAIISEAYAYADLPNFSSILDDYGVSITKSVIAENDKEHYYNWGGPFYLLPTVNSSDYTKSTAGNYVYVPASAGIKYEEQDGVTCKSLMDTTDKSVAKSDPNNAKTYELEDGDEAGPFSVALAVEKHVAADSDSDTKDATISDSTQLIVLGTPYLFSDEASQMTENNGEFFTDIVTALAGNAELAASVIPSKSFTLGNLTVPAIWSISIGIAMMIVVPVILLLLGIVIFAVRRKK